MSFKISDILDPTMVSELQKFNTTIDNLGTSFVKMSEQVKGSLEKTGKAYQGNQQAIQDLIKINQTQIELQKQKNKLSKDTNKLIEKSVKEQQKQTKVEKELTKTNNELLTAKAKLNKAVKDGKNVQEAYTKTIALQNKKVKDLKKLHGETSNIYLKEQKTLKTLKNQQNLFNKNLQKQAKFVKHASGSVNQLSLQLGKMKAAYRAAGASARKDMLKPIQQLDARVKRLDGSIGNYQRNVGNYKDALSKFGVQMGAVGAVMAGIRIGKDIAKTVAEFESSIAKVGAISGATGDDLKNLENLAKDLGRATTFTATEVANLEIELSKLGFSTKEIEKSTEGILFLAQATGEDLATSAEVAGATLRGFGLDASEMGRITDVMALSFSSSALDLTKFQESMKLVAPISRAANIDLETTTALLGNLADSGLSGSIAGTGLKNVISKLSNENSALSKELGFTVKNSDDLILAFQMLKDKNIDLTAATELTDERSKAAFLTMVNGIDSIAGLQTAFEGADGSAKAMADTMTNTMEGAAARLKSAWEGVILGFQIGDEEMKNGSVEIMNMAAEILNLITDTNFLGEAYGSLLNPLMDLFSAFGELGTLIQMISGETDAAENKFKSFSFILDILVTTTKLAAAPMIILFKAIGAIVKVITKLGKSASPELQKLQEAFSRITDVIKMLFKVGKLIIKNVFDKLKTSFSENNILIKLFKNNIKGLTGILNAISTGYERITKNLKGYTDALEDVQNAEINLIETEKKVNAEIKAAANAQADFFKKILADKKATRDAEAELDKKALEKYKKYLAEQNRVYQLYLDGLNEGRDKDILAEEFRLKQALEGVSKNSKEMEYQTIIHKNNIDNINKKYDDIELKNQEQKDAKEKAIIDAKNAEEKATAQKNFEDTQILEKSNFEVELAQMTASEEQKQELLKQFQIKQLDDRIAFLQEQGTAESDIAIQLLQNQIALLNATTEEIKPQAKQNLLEQYGVTKENMDAVVNGLSELNKARQDIAKQDIENSNLKIENLKKAIEEENNLGDNANKERLQRLKQSLSAEQVELSAATQKAVALQKRAILYKLATDQASAISSLIAMSNANPANAFTGGIAGTVQFALGIAKIIANFATAFSQLKSFDKGGYTGIGKEKDATGERVSGVVHEKEFVFDKYKTAKYRREFELLQKGVPFEKLISENLHNNIMVNNDYTGIESRLDKIVNNTKLKKNKTKVNEIYCKF